jgi:hypothetical protein
MVLLNAIVEVGALSDSNGFQTVTRLVLKSVCGIAGPDRLTVCLAAIDHNPLGSAMTLESLAQKAFGSAEVSPLAEPELDRVTIAIDRTVEIPPLGSDLDICFIDMPPAGDWALAPIEPIQQKRGVVNGAATNGCMVHGDATLGHDLLKISQAQTVCQIPPDAQQDH